MAITYRIESLQTCLHTIFMKRLTRCTHRDLLLVRLQCPQVMLVFVCFLVTPPPFQPVVYLEPSLNAYIKCQKCSVYSPGENNCKLLVIYFARLQTTTRTHPSSTSKLLRHFLVNLNRTLSAIHRFVEQ